MQYGNSAGNFDGLAFRRPLGHDSAGRLSKLVALLPNSMQIVHNWSEKGVAGTPIYTRWGRQVMRSQCPR